MTEQKLSASVAPAPESGVPDGVSAPENGISAAPGSGVPDGVSAPENGISAAPASESADDRKAPPDRFLRLIGLCRRAGRCIIGSEQVFAAMRTKDPPLLVIGTETASPPSKKKIRSMCAFYHVPLLVSSHSGDALASIVGRHSPVAALAVTEPHLAEELIKSSGKEVSVPTETED